MAQPRPIKPVIDRLMDRVMFEPNSGCWLWEGYVNRAGYGVIRTRTGTALAHRVAYEHSYGKIPDGLFACHKCDTPGCVRPDHLFLGGALENARDMHSKGRAASFEGEKNPNVKLTESQVAEIRASNGTLKDLAEKYGVATVTICRIRRGRAWAA